MSTTCRGSWRTAGLACDTAARQGLLQAEVGDSEKLAYLLQTLGAPLRQEFTRGPYAAELGHVLDGMDGHYLTGVGDRSAPVTEFAPIKTMPGSIDEATELLLQHPQAAAERVAVHGLLPA